MLRPFFQLGAYNPFVTRAIMDMLADRIGYGSVLLQLVGTLPLFLLTEMVSALGDVVAGQKWGARLREAVYSL